jgi:hypothetical protein
VIRLPNSQKLLELSQRLDQPLETEMAFVVNDAKSALQSLAQNFLPDQLIAASFNLSPRD